MDVRVGLWRKLSAEELMLLNCGVGEDSWGSLGLQGDPTSPFWRRSTLGFLWKEWCCSWNSSTLASSWEELTHWKRLWCWEGLGAGGEGDAQDEMAGWHHWLNGRESEWTPGVGDGQGGLACCNSCKESDTTEWLNWTDLYSVWEKYATFHLGKKIAIKEFLYFIFTLKNINCKSSHRVTPERGFWTASVSTLGKPSVKEVGTIQFQHCGG